MAPKSNDGKKAGNSVRSVWEIEFDHLPDDIDCAMTDALSGFVKVQDATVWSISDQYATIFVEMNTVGTKAVLHGYQTGGYTHMGEKRLNMTYVRLAKRYPQARVRLIPGDKPLAD